MTQSVFLRLLAQEDKAHALAEAVQALREGNADHEAVHQVDPASFKQVPGSPFAYWVSERIRSLFTELPPFESEGRTARVGLQTSDDFRFVRAWWEVPPERILDGANGPDWEADIERFQAWCRQRTREGKRWVPFAKGGSYSPYYANIHLVVNWENDGEEIRNFIDPDTGRTYSRPQNTDFYFRPGLTWPLRGIRFSAQSANAGSAFSVAGKMAFANDATELGYMLGLFNSLPFDRLIGLFAGKVGGVQYEVGLISKTPIPRGESDRISEVQEASRIGYQLSVSLASANNVSRLFVLPSFLKAKHEGFSSFLPTQAQRKVDIQQQIYKLQRKTDDIAFGLYGVSSEDRRSLEHSAYEGSGFYQTENNVEPYPESGSDDIVTDDSQSHVHSLLSYTLGCTFGRWDVRCATGEREAPELPDPFAPLPVCSPGMLTGADGLPLTETPADYSLEVDWDGVLVDDPDHEDDVIRRLRGVFELLFGARAEVIEREACEILGEKDLRGYFRKSSHAGFWMQHVRQYSQSRRKAPIYWLLQSSKKHYALWLYYHRLDKDLLYKALIHYVEPKLRLEDNRLAQLRGQLEAATQRNAVSTGGTSGREAKQLEKRLEQQEELLGELRDFEGKLRRAAELNLTPDLNDGVILNLAPLHELVPWKEAEKYWKELTEGKYDWSSVGQQLQAKGLVK